MRLRFNGKPYPAADVTPGHGCVVALAALTELDDPACSNLIKAFRAVLQAADAGEFRNMRFGVCHGVYVHMESPLYFNLYLVVEALGYAWAPARVIDGCLSSYFCSVQDAHSGIGDDMWEGEGLARRVQFMQFCVEELEEFMRDRSRTSCTCM